MTSDLMTLKEYREQVLRCPQGVIAKKARCPQGTISTLEGGKLPRPWNLDRFASAYEVSVNRLKKMVERARVLKAMPTPISKDMPLFASPVQNVTAREVVEAADVLRAAAHDPLYASLANSIGAEICAQKARQA